MFEIESNTIFIARCLNCRFIDEATFEEEVSSKAIAHLRSGEDRPGLGHEYHRVVVYTGKVFLKKES